MKKSIIAILLAGSAYFFAVPYIVVSDMRAAADAKNGEALSEHIEFESVRQSIKEQLNAIVLGEISRKQASSGQTLSEESPFAALGAMFASTLLDKAVDMYVTPAGVTGMMSGKKPAEEKEFVASNDQKKQPFENASMSYAGFDKFVVSVPSDETDDVRFVLRRRGIDWKLTEILLPMK